MPSGLIALALGGFGIGLTEFLIAGLWPQVASSFAVSEAAAGRLVSGYAPEKKSRAVALMFAGLTVANVLGVPFGALAGERWGWRAAFWAVTGIGVLALAGIAALVPGRAGQERLTATGQSGRRRRRAARSRWRQVACGTSSVRSGPGRSG